MKNLCNSLGITYLSAVNKYEYMNQREQWLHSNEPIVIEVFVNDTDESDALKLMNNILKDTSIKRKLKRSVLWKFARKIIRRK
jgi:hypothetical protein